jgi:hypothetical protein
MVGHLGAKECKQGKKKREKNLRLKKDKGRIKVKR